MSVAPAGPIWITRVEQPGAGIALAVKDLFDTAGLRTTYGSAIFRDHVPDDTAAAVARLEARGYAIAGKANLHEFAYGITSENPHFGDVTNPLAPGRVAGGSSGGNAAALAIGEVDAALGTDSGGSVRIPAACCGVTGFKPSHGLVPIGGCFPLAPSFDHVGPMGRDVGACAAMMGALVPGFAARPLESLEEVTVGVSWAALADPLVRGRVAAAASAFPRRVELELPLAEGFATVFMREAADAHRELFAEHRDLYGANVATKLERCIAVTDDEYEAGLRARAAYGERMGELMSGVDLVLTPTLGFVAPRTGIGDLALRDAMIRFTYPFNATGAPALALPCGAAEEELPASVQLAGPPGADALVLAAGAALEAALGHTADPGRSRNQREEHERDQGPRADHRPD